MIHSLAKLKTVKVCKSTHHRTVPFQLDNKKKISLYLPSKNALNYTFQINNAPKLCNLQRGITGSQNLFKAMFKP